MAPLRAKHAGQLTRLGAWCLAQGRSCDRDIAALFVDVLEDHRSPSGSFVLDRPTVNDILYAGMRNRSSMLGTVVPRAAPAELWTILDWLDAEGLLDRSSAPLAALREPLQCYAGLDENGRSRPDDADVEFACQCYIPYDPTVPSGMGKMIVGHGANFEPLYALGDVRPRSRTPSFSDLEPLLAFARRIRRVEWELDVHVEEFSHRGTVPEAVRTPALWIYTHQERSRRGFDPLVLDAHGALWRAHADRRRRAGYRWVEEDDDIAATVAGIRSAQYRPREWAYDD